ncbi:MAG: beta-propeller domain-containing protein [Oscillospiraceae bacterium]|nr:beta-propeller domain-containing protein [Oscillospiraceae bacterium]
MMKSNDDVFNEIRDQFSYPQELPENLSKEKIVSRLRRVRQSPKSTFTVRKIASLAAAAVIVFVCGFVAVSHTEVGKTALDQDPTVQEAAAQNAETPKPSAAQSEEDKKTEVIGGVSDDELLKHFLKLYRSDKMESVRTTIAAAIGTVDDVVNYGSMKDYGAPETSESTDSPVGREEYSSTNVQVQGVDEGDIIKNDGRYIYYAGSDSTGIKKLYILDGETMQVMYSGYVYDGNGDVQSISEVYVNGDTMTVLCNRFGDDGYAFYDSFSCCSFYEKGDVIISLYDISDRTSPKLLRTHEQQGTYISSRMVGNYLYTVSRYYVGGADEEEIKKNYKPKLNGELFASDCVYVMNKDARSYVSLTAIDTSKPESEPGKLAVLGDGNSVYATAEKLYVAGAVYDGYNGDYTKINSFTLEGTVIGLGANGKVKGTCINQYAMDEYDGYFRIATNYYDGNKDLDVSSLYILDGDLKVVSKLEDIARDERIQSVRFMGKRAYLVTFRNTDPLFTLDLSDPKNPKITGELKLPGYSYYLHPVGENLLLGIGYDGTAENADFESTKVSLFDISDISNPVEKSKLVYNNSACYVGDFPRAFLTVKSGERYCLPILLLKDNSYFYTQACKIISIENGELKEQNSFVCDTDDDGMSSGSSLRGAYMGDSFYCINDFSLVRYSLASGERTGQVHFYDKKSAGANQGYVVATTMPAYIPE